MGLTFADKFEQALAERRQQDPLYGLRTLARDLADGDRDRIESIRRRLNKYRPPKDGGTAKVKPTDPTRREIERAMGLPVDALAPDPVEEGLDQAALMQPLTRAISDLVAAQVDRALERVTR